MGDAGFLFDVHRALLRHDPEGNLLFVDGKATGKHVEHGRRLVELDQEVRNQDERISIVRGG